MVGLFFLKGLTERLSFHCYIGAVCQVSNFRGIGLADGDALYVRDLDCLDAMHNSFRQVGIHMNSTWDLRVAPLMRSVICNMTALCLGVTRFAGFPVSTAHITRRADMCGFRMLFVGSLSLWRI